MLLLSDQVEEAARRDKEAAIIGKEVEEGRKEVSEEIRRLLNGESEERTEEAMDVDRKEEGLAPVVDAKSDLGSREELGEGGRNVPIDEDEDEDEDLEEVA